VIAALTAVLLGQDPTAVVGDLSVRGHIFIGVVTVATLVFILRLVRRRQLAGKYAVLWTSVAIALGVLAIWPGLLTSLSEAVGVYYPPALFLLITTGFLFLIVIQFSWELSRNEDRTRTLAEEIALLRAELDLPPRSDGAEGDDHAVGGVAAAEAGQDPLERHGERAGEAEQPR
jgi:hypothetical protein